MSFSENTDPANDPEGVGRMTLPPSAAVALFMIAKQLDVYDQWLAEASVEVGTATQEQVDALGLQGGQGGMQRTLRAWGHYLQTDTYHVQVIADHLDRLLFDVIDELNPGE